jgi:hypothetical protein
MTNDEILQKKIAATQSVIDWQRRQMFFMSPSEKSMWYSVFNERVKVMLEADKLKFSKAAEQVSRCVK